MKFYTYTWFRSDGTPYYVGKGQSLRAFLSRPRHRPPKDPSRIVLLYWPDEATAFAYEMYQIYLWGRKDLGTGILRNRTDGGEGTAGHTHTEAWKLAQSQRVRIQMSDPASIEIRRLKAKKQFASGQHHKDYREVSRQSAILQMSDPESRAKVSAAMKGRIPIYNSTLLIEKRIHPEELPNYAAQGYIKGRCPKPAA